MIYTFIILSYDHFDNPIHRIVNEVYKPDTSKLSLS